MISKVSSKTLNSLSGKPCIHDLRAQKDGGIVHFLLFNDNMAPAVRTFSSVYMKTGLDLELTEATQEAFKGFGKQTCMSNEDGMVFHESKHSALSLQMSGSAFGNDTVQPCSEDVSFMRFPQRLMPKSSFEDHLKARRLFYSQRFQTRKGGTSKRIASALDYATYQPLRRKLRVVDFDQSIEIFFYVPLGQHSNPKFFLLVIDEKGTTHRLEGSLGADSADFTFTSNWSLSLLDDGLTVDPSMPFYLTNIVLDKEKKQHFFACRSSFELPRLFMVTCDECASSLGVSQFCSGRGYCFELHELMDEGGLTDSEIKKRMDAKRTANEQYNERLQHYRLGHTSLSSIFLADQAARWPLADVETMFVGNGDEESFVCRMGANLYRLYTTVQLTATTPKRLETKVTEVVEYSIPEHTEVVCCSPFIEKKCFYYLNKKAEFHYFDLENDWGEEKHEPLRKDFCPLSYLSSVRIFAAGVDTIACYFHEGKQHGLLCFRVNREAL